MRRFTIFRRRKLNGQLVFYFRSLLVSDLVLFKNVKHASLFLLPYRTSRWVWSDEIARRLNSSTGNLRNRDWNSIASWPSKRNCSSQTSRYQLLVSLIHYFKWVTFKASKSITRVNRSSITASPLRVFEIPTAA